MSRPLDPLPKAVEAAASEMLDGPDWRLKRRLRLAESEAKAWKERALKAEEREQGLLEERNGYAEEMAQSHYYRECRDYWRTQAESLAALIDRHNRDVHQAMSHEQLFAPPKREA
jgi:hypothetical protein